SGPQIRRFASSYTELDAKHQRENAGPNFSWQFRSTNRRRRKILCRSVSRLKPECYLGRTAACRDCRGIESAAPLRWQVGTRKRDGGTERSGLAHREREGRGSSSGHRGRRLRGGQRNTVNTMREGG